MTGEAGSGLDGVEAPPELQRTENRPLREVAGLFLKLGTVAFGGPAAHVAMMRNEVVERRGWLSDAAFLDLLGGANLLPGPSSTQLALFLGYVRAGPPGLLLGGVLFIAPAFLIVLTLAWAYERFGSLPATGWLLYGVKPAVIAIVLYALWGLARSAVRSVPLLLLGVSVLVLFLLGMPPIVLLLGAGAVGLGARSIRQLHTAGGYGAWTLGLALLPAASPAVRHAAKGAYSAWLLFLTFLKIGGLLFGGGYVLLAFVQADFVHNLGWLNDREVLDAVAVGQVTPGPLFTTATFIGYLVGGMWGAVVATVGIFLPSFLYAPLVFPWIRRLRASAVLSGGLDAVNAGALGLMAGVTWTLGRSAIVDPLTAVIGAAALVLLLRRVNGAWLVLGSGAVGFVYRMWM